MTKRIINIGSKERRIVDTSRHEPRIDPAWVARELGAERVFTMPSNLSPPTIRALRASLFAALRSTGGRPGLEGVEHRPKIPMTDTDWQRLDALARELAEDGFAPTAGQVASQLLHDALARLDAKGSKPLATRAGEAKLEYALAGELADRSSPREAASRTVTGFHVDVSSEELVSHLRSRSKWHAGRAEQLDREHAEVARARSRELMFMADHVAPGGTFRMTAHDLEFIELVGRRTSASSAA